MYVAGALRGVGREKLGSGYDHISLYTHMKFSNN